MSHPSVHLVGSIPLQDSRAVFQAAAQALGARLRRIPDGETGIRSNWAFWQMAVFEKLPQMSSEQVEMGGFKVLRLRLKPGAGKVSIGPLGYAQAAIDSYGEFRKLREEGVIRQGTRFLVSLPTPLASVTAFVAPESVTGTLPAYEDRMRREVEEMSRTVPHRDLAIQWDVAIEFAIFEQVVPSLFKDPAEILGKLTDYGSWIDHDIELGYHLCYGDLGHRHFKEPVDTSWLVRVANHLASSLQRPLAFLHLPVPRERTDEAYYRPLAELSLDPATELYLGLLHVTDGIEGARQRMQVARRFVPRFGIATECGMGRRPPQTIPALLELHARACELATRTDLSRKGAGSMDLG